MPKIELLFGQRMENFFICLYITAGNIQSVKDMVSKRRDIRVCVLVCFFFFLSTPVVTSWFCVYVFYMQHDSVRLDFLLFAVSSIQGYKHICAASVGWQICCFEDLGCCSFLWHV